MKRKGFTLIEMLVVIGIIGLLIAATAGSIMKMAASADNARCQELVHNTATALTALFQKEGVWPKVLRTNGATDGLLDENTAYPLANGYLSLTTNNGKLSGYDKFGIVTPWATTTIKNRGTNAKLSDRVPGGSGTIQDHILHYALDLDGDGIIEGASVGGESIDVRATAIVWACGKDGKIEAYSRGLRKDDCYSWAHGQTKGVK